jgi:hypothetical protein
MSGIKTVYIAGPYSGGNTEDNVRAALMAAHAIMDLGATPFVPHLSHYLHLLRPRSYEEWMDYDFVWLDRSDALLRLPGISPGAEREVKRMQALNRPVFHTLATLAAYLGAKP